MHLFSPARAAAAVVTVIVFHQAFAADLGTAAPETVGMTSNRLARLDNAIHAYVDKGRTPGVVTLIARHGKIVHVDAYGSAEIGGRKTSKDDIFRMYSMTKPITSGKIAKADARAADGYGDTVFGGLSVSTTAGDYARFAQMLLNKGELDGVRLLSPKTVELMAANHLPEAAMKAGGLSIGAATGTGYGLGVSVLLDPVLRGNLGSAGEFGWSGAASTHVLIDPKEDLVAIYCTQLLGGDFALRAEFATLVYQSIVGE